jgi:hypothetical protein
VLAFLRVAGEAALQGTAAPSLLPASRGGLNAYGEGFLLRRQLVFHEAPVQVNHRWKFA